VLPTWGGVIFLLAGLALFVIGLKADILFALGLSFLLVVAGIVWTLMGKIILKELAFPIGILGFMIPLPYLLLDPIGFPMKEFAAATSAGLLQAFGVPIFQDGVYLYLPHYLLVVEDVCNGLRSLISMTMVGTVLGYILLPTVIDRVILTSLSIPIALGANILRILLTAVLGYYVSGEFAQGFLHEFSGLFVFLVSLGALMGVERILSWREHDSISPPLSV
jgi:exosortase